MLGLLSAVVVLAATATPGPQGGTPAVLPGPPGNAVASTPAPVASTPAPAASTPPSDASPSVLLVVEPATASTAPVGPPAAPLTPGAPLPLPPGWNYGVLLDSEGNRWVVPVPPGVELPPLTTRSDPLEQARLRLEMLRVALDGYFDSAIQGVNEYPRAASLADLAALLKRSDLLPDGWRIEGQLVQFQLSPYRYRIALVVADRELVIA